MDGRKQSPTRGGVHWSALDTAEATKASALCRRGVIAAIAGVVWLRAGRERAVLPSSVMRRIRPARKAGRRIDHAHSSGRLLKNTLREPGQVTFALQHRRLPSASVANEDVRKPRHRPVHLRLITQHAPRGVVCALAWVQNVL